MLIGKQLPKLDTTSTPIQVSGTLPLVISYERYRLISPQKLSGSATTEKDQVGKGKMKPGDEENIEKLSSLC